MSKKPLISAKEASLPTIYTIGHSNREANELIQILRHYKTQLVADVRSEPYSKYCPQFNKETIKQALANSGIGYIFLGKELGARPEDQNCYINGSVSFEKLRISDTFKQAISRLLDEAAKKSIVLMCAEKDPINCHRAILISRVLEQQGAEVKHIISETEMLDHLSFEKKLLRKFKIQETLFDTESSKKIYLNEAYEKQEKIISYQEDVQEAIIW